MSRANNYTILSGSAHPEFAQLICKYLNVELGDCLCGKFSNGETSVIINESIRGKNVYIIQPTCGPSQNDNIMELLVLVDAVRRASSIHITVVIPFFGYSRRNKKEKSREPITAKLIANMIEVSGVNRVISMDLEAAQIQSFFNCPVDNLYAEPLIVKYIEKNIPGDKRVVVSPAVDGVKRAKLVSDKLGCDLAILDRQIQDDEEDGMILVGDTKDMVAIIIGSIADTCETLALSAKILKKYGASKVYALCSHGELSGGAIDTIINCPELEELVITNSIPQSDRVKSCKKIKIINVAAMFGEALRRIIHSESITSASSKFTIL